MAEISRQPRPGGRVAQSTTDATANADGEPAGTAASYTADGENVPGGAATVASRASTIAFDGSAGTGELLPGPGGPARGRARRPHPQERRAVLRPAAVHLPTRSRARRDRTPTAAAADRRSPLHAAINTNEPDHRVQLLHRNILRFGTITNTLAAACRARRHDPRRAARSR